MHRRIGLPEVSALTDAVGRYGAVAVGLALGTAAKWGLALGDGHSPTWRDVLVDILLLGLLGLIAVTVSDWAGLVGNAKVLAGAMTAVSSDRLVRLMRRRFEQSVLAEVDRLPTAKLARIIGGEPKPTPPDMAALLDRIEEADAAAPENASRPGSNQL